MENTEQISAGNECLKQSNFFNLPGTCSLRTERLIEGEHDITSASSTNLPVSVIHSNFVVPPTIRSKRRFDSCSSTSDSDSNTSKVSFICSPALKRETISPKLSCKKLRKRSKKHIKLSTTICFGDDSLGTAHTEHSSLKYDTSSIYIKGYTINGGNNFELKASECNEVKPAMTIPKYHSALHLMNRPNFIPIWKRQIPTSSELNDPYEFPPSTHMKKKSKVEEFQSSEKMRNITNPFPHSISSRMSVSVMSTSNNKLHIPEPVFEEDRNHKNLIPSTTPEIKPPTVYSAEHSSMDKLNSMRLQCRQSSCSDEAKVENGLKDNVDNEKKYFPSVDNKIMHIYGSPFKRPVMRSEGNVFLCSKNYIAKDDKLSKRDYTETKSINTDDEDVHRESVECSLTPILIDRLRWKSKLKNALPLSSMERSGRRVRFDSVKVFYFGRCQGGVTVPKSGEITLAMLDEHFTHRHFSLSSGRRPDLTLLPFTEGDLSEGEISGDIFDPIEFERCTTATISEIEGKARVKLLKRSGVRVQRCEEKLESIRQSRIECGCNCIDGICLPESCQCYKDGIKCQVDGQAHDGSGNTHPCWCSTFTCSNPMGRVEFDPERVKIHYITTIKRMKDMERTGIYGSPLVIKFEDDAQTQYSYCSTPPPAAYVSSPNEKETPQRKTSSPAFVTTSYLSCSTAEDLAVPKYPVTPIYKKTNNERLERFSSSTNPVNIELPGQKDISTKYKGKEELKLEESRVFPRTISLL